MKKWRVLIADDDEATTELLKLRFEMAGFEVLAAYNGEEAVNLFERSICEKKEIDLAVLDYEMPKMKGDVAAVRILNISRRNKIEEPQMLIFTGSTDQNLILRLNTAGIGVVLIKPHGFEQLERFIARIGAREHDRETRDADNRSPSQYYYTAANYLFGR